MTTLISSTATREPRYSIIARQLANDIEQGRFTVGDLLPTESELTRDFGASRHTVREAVKHLQVMGLVATRRGRGSEVIAAQPIRPGIGFSFDNLNDFLIIAEVTKLTKIRKTHDRVGQELSSATGWNVDERCLCIKALRASTRDELHIAYVEIYLRGQYASIEPKIARKTVAISKLIESEFGLRTKEVRQSIFPQIISKNVANRLDVAEGSLGLRVERIYISEADETFMFVVSHQSGDSAHIDLRIRYGKN